ncbi:uncharacterized protein LOC111713572 [Eurytemora carolleeae]|uniref:uncharacterized protein LOC111713572 n=1 Tax=Eurytemora carolleeae TaxID=1294199 RepID=UPI000C79125F|nr:uncharacterized protein LOC111713572 [Eurytemora carolleeae]|eukprot:XP_023344220.1 uncharacterized protein LOC111713572 [Eurytemora affinis]
MDYQDYVESTASPEEFYIPRNESFWPSVLFLDPGEPAIDYDAFYDTKEKKEEEGEMLQLVRLIGETAYEYEKRQECQNKNKVFSKSDIKCYEQLTRGPCAEDEVFFDHEETYQGECRKNVCQNVKELLLTKNGSSSCVDVKTDCKGGMQRYYDRFGGTACGCMKNLLYDEELEECFNEFSHGNCSHGTWRRNETQADENVAFPAFPVGYCKPTNCSEGEIEYKSGICYRLDDSIATRQCNGEIILENDSEELHLICSSDGQGRNQNDRLKKYCRKGYNWNNYKKKCVKSRARFG